MSWLADGGRPRAFGFALEEEGWRGYGGRVFEVDGAGLWLFVKVMVAWKGSPAKKADDEGHTVTTSPSFGALQSDSDL